MKVNWKSKKVMAMVGGGITAVLTLSLGLGLGLGLQSDDEPAKYKILGQEYTEAELKPILEDGITSEGVTYHFQKKNDGFYLTLPASTVLTASSVTMKDTSFGRNILVGGDNPQPVAGENHFYNIDYAGIGVVKIPNDGYVWGGYYLNDNNEPVLRTGLSEPVEFGRINENGDALLRLGRIFIFQFNIKTDQSVNENYVLNSESEDALYSTRIFAYQKGSQTVMKVAVNSYPDGVPGILNFDPFLTPDQFVEEDDWPLSSDGKPYWGKEKNHNPEPQAFNNENHPEIKFRLGDLFNADGSPQTLTWAAGELPNLLKDEIKMNEFFYKVNIKGGKIKIPLLDDQKIQVQPDGKFKLGDQTFQIPKKQDSYTLTTDVEVKLIRSN